MENFLTEPRSWQPSLQFVGAVTSAHIICALLHKEVVSSTGALILTAVNLSGRETFPSAAGHRQPRCLGKILYTIVLNKMALPGQKRGYGAFRKNTGKGEAELLLLDLVTFVTTPPLIKELDTFCLPTRHFGGFNSPWATIFSLGGLGYALAL